MKQTVYFDDFNDAFKRAGRENNFSYEGRRALYDYLVDLEDNCGIEHELDVIGLCCDFTEYSDLEEFHGDYNKEDYPDIETIEEHTLVIPVGDEGFIIQCF